MTEAINMTDEEIRNDDVLCYLYTTLGEPHLEIVNGQLRRVLNGKDN